MAALELVGGHPNPKYLGQEEGSSGYPQEKSEYWTGKPQTAMQQPQCTPGPLSWLVLAQEG